MRRLFASILVVLLTLPLFAAANFGRDTVTSEWFREWYQWSELKHFLDNNCDFTVYTSETTGEWATPEPYLFSINGNSYRWNKYYLNDFRLDNRTTAGDAFYTPDMFTHSMAIDYNRGAVIWERDTVVPNRIRVTGQGGNVGGYSGMARWLLEHIEGRSAIQRLYNDEPIHHRKHIIGAGSVDGTYSIPLRGKTYAQHLNAAYGVRQQLRYNHDGICGTYDADYYQLQLDGQVPVAPTVAFDALYYILRAAYRGDGYSEFGYNENEAAQQLKHSFSIYGRKDFGRRGTLTTGLTYGLQRTIHRQADFSRNILDVDGEAFEPWYPDGHTHELNWAVNYRFQILPWLGLHVEGYNSFFAFRPSQDTWTNTTFLQGYNMASPLMLNDYHWSSSAFNAGMLENAVRLEATRQVLEHDGWYHTGDLATMSADGHIFIRGRLKNMLLGANGQNIYPEEIEDKLNSMAMVNESLIVQRDDKLVALVYPDMDEARAMGFTEEDLQNIMEQNRQMLNSGLPVYSKIQAFELREEEFQKTPKKSIKRYLYK